MVSRPLSVHQEHELLGRMEAAGLDRELAQKVIDSKGNELAAEVVRFVREGDLWPITRRGRAREIMGENFFGIDEVEKYFKVCPTFRQIHDLSWVPYSEATLQACKDTHVLVAVFPLSVLEIRGKVERSLFCSHEDAWYNKQAFAKDKGEVHWQLVRKTPVENSTNKTWQDQQALLAKNEETPTAQVMTYTIIGHYLATGVRLLENVYVRCSSVGSGGGRVSVGDFDSRGLDIRSYSDNSRFDDLVLSSARKFDFPVRR